MFADVLNCAVPERDFGLAHPNLFGPFLDGRGFSVEFSTRAALCGEPARKIDDSGANRGAWIEFRTSHLARDLERLRAAGTVTAWASW